MKDGTGPIIIMVIIALVLFGGSKGASKNGLFPVKEKTPVEKQTDIQKQITEAQKKVEALKKQIAAEEAKKYVSQYSGIVDLGISRTTTDPAKEYAIIRVSNKATTTIPVTGWKLKSVSSGVEVYIPKGTYLFFTGTINSEEDVYLQKNETLYLVTGISPNGSSFKTNKCSGYLSQFQTFTPRVSTQCPAPRNEDLSSIPKTVANEDCLDYINRMSSCRIQTKTLPVNWNYECTNFIYTKVNYPSCVNTHKNDKDFYKNEWHLYLKRSDKIWGKSHDNIILYDQFGKIVDEYKY